MRQFVYAHRYALLCILLSLIAFSPALIHPALPAGTDVDLHFWRVHDLENNWNQGDVLARWSELYYYGYGAPSFQYSAPGFYALSALVGKIPLVDDVARIKIVWFIGILAACIGMYRYAVKRWSPEVALVSATAFAFSPALILHESLLRGSFGVILGMGFAALALSYLDDVLNERKHIIPAALSVFIVLTSHNITAIMFGGVLFAWLLWQIIFTRSRHVIRDALYALLAFFAGCGLSAFFWIPLAFELRLVDVERMAQSTDLDYRQGFHALSNLLTFPNPLDTTLRNPPPQTTLGLAHWIIAGLGALVALGGLRTEKIAREMLFWIPVALVSVFLILPIAAPVWERITPLQTILFPIRFLNVAAFALAILAGAGAFFLQKYWRFAWMILLVAIGFTGLMSTPWLWREDFPREATNADYLAYELNTGTLGTTAANEFLPPDVALIPPPTGFVLDTLSSGATVQRLNITAYPEGTQIEVIESAPDRYRFTVDAPTPLTLEVYQLYFPLWRVTVNGDAVDARPSEPYGFMLVDVPAGENTVELTYPLTAPQTVGLAVSLITVMALGAYAVILRSDHHNSTQTLVHVQNSMLSSLSKWRGDGGEVKKHYPPFYETFIPVLILALIAFGVGSGMFGYVASSENESVSADQALDVVFEDVAVLSGISTHEPFPGRVWEIDLYWHFSTDETVNSFVHLLNTQGEIVAQLDKLDIQSTGHTHQRDSYVLYAPSTLPPQDYTLRIGLWQCLDETNRFECTVRTTPTTIMDGQPNPDGWITLAYP